MSVWVTATGASFAMSLTSSATANGTACPMCLSVLFLHCLGGGMCGIRMCTAPFLLLFSCVCVSPPSVPCPLRYWSELPLDGAVVKEMAERFSLTPFQRQAIPVCIRQRDMIGVTYTGSGKLDVNMISLLVSAAVLWISATCCWVRHVFAAFCRLSCNFIFVCVLCVRLCASSGFLSVCGPFAEVT